MGKKTETNRSYRDRNASVTVSVSFMVHLICVLGLAIAFWVAQNVYSINLVSDPTQTLILLWVVESPIVILLYSLLRRNPEQCSYLKAVGRGIVGLPIGALLMAFGAVILGAPIGIQYLEKTVNWSLLMSLFTVVPTACVFGSSWEDWQRLFAYTKPVEVLDYIICVPAHGAVIGTWLGAWPMPLDWERPWQEWPVCVSYGAVAGYLLGILASLAFMLVFGGRRQHLKGE
ncbi:GPI biosynthesis protein Pig-F [Macleaya cordata]|uniref:GPI biosynthesis protein Pig-F n=1 Tax=Macleaya cordata TaxID=56857 RepID=A0A200QH60_MACCD|nr:GPI biosynthesis protein Pig-F [Macleaya cordata]